MSTVHLVKFESRKGREWDKFHLPYSFHAMGGVAVEHRYIDDLVEGMKADGLVDGVDFSDQMSER